MIIKRSYTLITYRIKDNGTFPNNEFLPVLHYKQVLGLSWLWSGWAVRKMFRKNGWTNSWRNSIYDYDHYHSSTHEVMGVIKGKTLLMLGGDGGQKIFLEKGDVIIIPAGVAHRNVTPKKKFVCVGAYPDGIEFDMNYEKEARPVSDERIKKVRVPQLDPIFGKGGEIRHYW